MNTKDKSDRDFWSRINEGFSDADREAFNRWRIGMYLACDRARDLSHGLPDTDQSGAVSAAIRDVMAAICEVPYMLDDRGSSGGRHR